MYFIIGWPKTVTLSLTDPKQINHICCDGVKILVGAISDDFVGIWYAKPLIPITSHQRSPESVEKYGRNRHLVWKPDSSKLAIITDKGCLIFYQIEVDDSALGVLNQVDSPSVNLKRDSAELFIKEVIPRLYLRELCNVSMDAEVSCISCISLSEIMVATTSCQMVRIMWDDLEDSENVIDLRRVTFYSNPSSGANKSVPLMGVNAYIKAMDYSPLIGGFAVVFSDSRAAFLTATHLKFEQDKIHGIWIPDLEDATCCAINHKFRLLAFGRNNSEAAVYAIEDTTGSLEFSHKLAIDAPGTLGAVAELKWSPDGCALVLSWENGGLAVWSTFGTLLTSSLNWDFGLHVDLQKNNPLVISRMEWSTEGYQLFLLRKNERPESPTNVLLLDFVKSTLCMNPCMASNSHILLQSDSTLYINQGNNLEKIYFGSKVNFPNNYSEEDFRRRGNVRGRKVSDDAEINSEDVTSILSESKYWTIVQLPLAYSSTNWPIRYSAIDSTGVHVAVAGRTGLAHYSILTKKWKLFGNETQEKDFVVTGGLLWFEDFIVMGCFSLIDRSDEIRAYPRDSKLDNQYMTKIQVKAPVFSLNLYKTQLVVLTADGVVSVYNATRSSSTAVSMECVHEIDIRRVCIHPACIVSLTVTNLKTDSVLKTDEASAETVILNVSGRILMTLIENRTNVVNTSMATCLASCVECFWLSNTERCHMKDCLWLYSGAHGMRVWLPIRPPDERSQNQYRHTFMSKRIMLSFPLKLYPLVIMFENVIVLGADSDTTLYTNDRTSHYSLPYCFLERKSQVYLHKILRQLIKRNLGYSAWEIAKSCRDLPYFPHSLELLLHEVLEEEATSKDPIPDALLPSVLDFIREFPVHLKTIVQCARKTEIALWPYLFSIAGKPKDLFQQSLEMGELETAASYLIILQNLEPSSVSKQFAMLLLDIALENKKWELGKDLIRFLKAIDPNEVDSPRSSFIINNKIAPNQQSQVNPDPEVFNLILGPIARERSFSTPMAVNVATKPGKNRTTSQNDEANTTSSQKRKSERSVSKEKKEIFFIDTILQRHASKLLENNKLIDLGYMSAFLDFHLVSWLSQENDRSAKIEDFVDALCHLHVEFNLPTPLSSDSDELTLKSLDLGTRNPTTSHTSESGYFSLPLGDQIDAIQSHYPTGNIPCIKECSEGAADPSVRRFERYNSLPNGPILPPQDQLIEVQGKCIPEKLEVKLRYLLQLFIEANCIDYALILSIILLDAASIGRIINFVVRTESLNSCNRIQNALKTLMHWSFQERTGYRRFMMTLQPQLTILDHYVTQKTSLIEDKRKKSIELTISEDELEELASVPLRPSKCNNPDKFKTYPPKKATSEVPVRSFHRGVNPTTKSKSTTSHEVTKSQEGLCVLM